MEETFYINILQWSPNGTADINQTIPAKIIQIPQYHACGCTHLIFQIKKHNFKILLISCEYDIG